MTFEVVERPEQRDTFLAALLNTVDLDKALKVTGKGYTRYYKIMKDHGLILRSKTQNGETVVWAEKGEE